MEELIPNLVFEKNPEDQKTRYREFDLRKEAA
jgi:hypothetical protein